MVGSRLRTILAWTSLVVTLVAIIVVVVQMARAEGGTPETVFVLVLAVGVIAANLAQLVVKARPRLRAEDDVIQLTDVARSPSGVATLYETTGGDPSASA